MALAFALWDSRLLVLHCNELEKVNTHKACPAGGTKSSMSPLISFTRRQVIEGLETMPRKLTENPETLSHLLLQSTAHLKARHFIEIQNDARLTVNER